MTACTFTTICADPAACWNAGGCRATRAQLDAAHRTAAALGLADDRQTVQHHRDAFLALLNGFDAHIATLDGELRRTRNLRREAADLMALTTSIPAAPPAGMTARSDGGD